MRKKQKTRILVNEKGFTTLTSMILIFSLLSGVLLSYRFISALTQRNELYRREVVLSRNVLLSYNRILFEGYGLLAYDESEVDLAGLIKNQFEERKFKSVQHEVRSCSALNTSSQLLPQINEVATLRMVDELVEEQKQFQELSQVLRPSLESFEKISQADELPQVSRGGRREAQEAAEEPAILKIFKAKMSRLKNLSKENGMGWKTELLGSSSGGSGTVHMEEVQVMMDKNPNLPEKTMLTLYITGTFADRVVSKGRELSFYNKEKSVSPMPNSEVEYILIGSENKEFNKKAVAAEIFAIRSATQMVSILADRPLMLKIQEEALALTAVVPAVPLPVFVASLVAIEAGERASADMKKILNGEGVSFMQKKVVTGVESKMYQEVFYDDFLRLLLFAADDQQTLERMLAVIATSQKISTGMKFDFEKMVTRHRVLAICRGKVLTQVEFGYLRDLDKVD